MNATERTCLSHWFPIVAAGGLPVPATEIIRTGLPLGNMLDGEAVPGIDAFLDEVRAAIARLGGCPVFLRTGHTSGKHDWERTCYLASTQDLLSHVYALVENSHLVDLFGLSTDVWVVRELLPTVPAFLAFGGMPITKERRYFVRDGVATEHFAYWPADAIHTPSVAHWPNLLASISEESPAEVAELTALTERVGALLPGYWSVDWLWTTNRGWCLTDMAAGELSWHPAVGEEG